MYEIEKQLEEIRNNISKVSNEVINSFNRIQNLKIPSDAKVLILSTPITVKYIKVTLFVNEDMFEPVDVEEHDGYISSIYRMTDEFFLYKYLGLKKIKMNLMNFTKRKMLKEKRQKQSHYGLSGVQKVQIFHLLFQCITQYLMKTVYLTYLPASGKIKKNLNSNATFVDNNLTFYINLNKQIECDKQ